jgi:hypothetical protein
MRNTPPRTSIAIRLALTSHQHRINKEERKQVTIVPPLVRCLVQTERDEEKSETKAQQNETNAIDMDKEINNKTPVSRFDV